MYPDDRRYSKDHEWIRLEGKRATIGITHFAQDQLGDIVYVELPEPGKRVAADEVLGTIESVKAVSEIFAPVACTVLESNQELEPRPEAVNADPHGAGWYCKVEVEDPAAVEALMDAAAYREHVESR